jgi:hypothetical protein
MSHLTIYIDSFGNKSWSHTDVLYGGLHMNHAEYGNFLVSEYCEYSQFCVYSGDDSSVFESVMVVWGGLEEPPTNVNIPSVYIDDPAFIESVMLDYSVDGVGCIKLSEEYRATTDEKLIVNHVYPN